MDHPSVPPPPSGDSDDPTFSDEELLGGPQPPNVELDWLNDADVIEASLTIREAEIIGREADVARREATLDRRAPRPGVDAVERLRSHLLVGDAILTVPKPAALVAAGANGVPVLGLDELAVLYGPSGKGKTTTAIDLACCIATGSSWHGHAVTKAQVLYVIAEGVGGIASRVGAWLSENKVTSVGSIAWLPEALNLTDRRAVTALVGLATSLCSSLVVIDTLARCAAGADESSARDMGLLVDAADRIRLATGACVLFVHHSGKDESAGARGSSALNSAADTEIRLTGDSTELTLKATKARCGPEGTIGRYRLQPTGGSVVLAPTNGAGNLNPKMLEALKVLSEIVTDEGVAPSVWLRCCGNEMAERTFYRARKQLLEQGLTANVGTEKRPLYTLTEQGHDATNDRTAMPLPFAATAAGSTLPARESESLGSDSGSKTTP